MFGSLIHRALRGEKTSRPPFWFMRQAGRYLPEYREIRASTGGFLSLCFTPKLAAEVTLQPLRRFDMDAAILFSDILVIPQAMGMDLRFEEGEGPKLNPVYDKKSIEALHTNVEKHLEPIMETLRIVRSELPQEKSLIGFCGAPWTVACYMVEGGGSRDYEKVRRFAYIEKEAFTLLIEKIIKASVTYLSMQVKAGADILQIFDSWAGVLSENEYKNWVIIPTKKIVSQIKNMHPEIPIIGFPRGSGAGIIAYEKETGVDAVSLDVQTPLLWARDALNKTIQGNLNPIQLASDKEGAVAETKNIMRSWKNRPYIFNLGHGIIPSTPIENLQAVCDTIRGYKA